MTSERSRTPDWLVERIALNELPADELARARAKLLAEPDGQARLEAIERSNRELLASHPPAMMTPMIEQRLRAARRRDETASVRSSVRWLAGLSIPLAAAAALVLTVQTRHVETIGVEPEETTRIKGAEPKLQIHRQVGDGAERLAEGATVRAGDVIQVGFTRGDHAYGVVLSIDGAGAVTVHLPDFGDQAAALTGSGLRMLDYAYELDDAPGFERFFLITSNQPFRLDPVEAAAERLAANPAEARTGTLDLPEGLDQVTFLLAKETP